MFQTIIFSNQSIQNDGCVHAGKIRVNPSPGKKETKMFSAVISSGGTVSWMIGLRQWIKNMWSCEQGSTFINYISPDYNQTSVEPTLAALLVLTTCRQCVIVITYNACMVL